MISRREVERKFNLLIKDVATNSYYTKIRELYTLLTQAVRLSFDCYDKNSLDYLL